jgi:hypothetical protein
MDPAILTYIVQGVGGAVAGNILGALTRGGGGIAGRTIIGAIGGVAAGYGAEHVEAVGNIASNWGSLMPNDATLSGHIANAITGAAGGGILGLIGGLLIRQRG